MSSNLVRTNTAGLRYVNLLQSAYQRFLWLSDPDYAHQQDWDAWAKIRRDATLGHLIERRQHAAAGEEWQLVPASERPVDQRAAEIMTDLLQRLRRFHQARKNMAEAIFRGSSWAFVNWRREWVTVKGDRPRMWLVPRRLDHVDRWRFRIQRVDPNVPSSGQIETVWKFYSLGQQQWIDLTPEMQRLFIRVTFADLEETLGYGRGLLQAIFFYWRSKVIALTQGLVGLERWSMGILKGAVDGNRPGSVGRSNDDIRDQFKDELVKHRAEHVIIHDKNDEVEVLTGGSEGSQIVQSLLEYLDRGLTQLILHSVRPTGGNTEMGSQSQGEVEENTSESVFRSDRKSIAEDIDCSLIAELWKWNLAQTLEVLRSEGHVERPERPTYEQTSPRTEKPSEVVGVIQTLLGVGVALKKEEVYEKTGFSMPDDDDEVFEGGQDMAGGGLEGLLGGGNGEGTEGLFRAGRMS